MPKESHKSAICPNHANRELPSRPGTYAIICESGREKGSIRIGRIGRLELKQGYYAYVGSAFGPGGLKARVSRHLLGPKRLRWHIDYLGKVAKPKEVWYTCDPVIREHDWAGVMAQWRATSIPLRGFGASDCRCESHLFFFRDLPDIGDFRDKLRLTCSDHGSLSVHKLP
ncbi:MAG: GIY-YIG nuclease family protein [Deltaproteobacteria bacterium]|nr:GIY-YIG nuclease family protein [Deltaproteobacteria bacterium]